MNEYKQKYTELTKEINDISNGKILLTRLLEEKEKEYSAQEEDIDDIKDDIEEIVYDKNKVLKKGQKKVDTFTNVLIVALLVGTIALGIVTYNVISPISIIIKLTTIVGLSSGGLVIFSVLYSAINDIYKYLKKKISNKNQSKEEYKELEKEFYKKNKELQDKVLLLDKIEREINELKDEITKQYESLSSKEDELRRFIEKILKEAMEIPNTEALSYPIRVEHKEKPYIRERKR